MPVAQIQARTDAIFAQQDFNEMGTQRYSLLFKPGVYGTPSQPLNVKVGYYTEVAGLGQGPDDVTINGTVTAAGHNDGSGALTTFWRSVSNLKIHFISSPNDGCHTSNEMWAVSQAAPMRRVHVEGYTTFMPYCENPNYASGGFVADSYLEAGALNGSQQQFYARNSNLGGGWSNSVWNQVFSGDINAPGNTYGGGTYYTTLATTPVSKEKPYLYIDGAGEYKVFVPSVQHDSVGTTWANGHTPGTSLPMSSFFIAKPSDSVQAIDNALSKGQNLLLTPGVYDAAQTIKVQRADTVVLGMGYATLTARNGVTALETADVAGIVIAGLTLDAGPVNSDVLMRIGSKNGNNGVPHQTAGDPTALMDVFFRIGGPHVGKATTSLEVNQDNTLLDHLWIWRADHGVSGSVGWTINTADHGLIVNGDNVTATGLFVEHFQKEDVIWNGENGVNIFFQHETPYDPPSQAAWDQPGPFVGYPAFQVADNVAKFHAYGMGSYVVQNQTDATAYATAAYQAPVRPGVQFTHIDTVWIVGNGGYLHVINNTGGPAVAATGVVPVSVVQYP
ncbi:MAG: hypothetical protein QOF58_8241 [Pseudonocardiales bacterium]|nr:hypothetical protein [Pseudonocardiales bacterium]